LTWSEKLLAKAKSSGIKDILLVKVMKKLRRKLMKGIELIFSINVMTSCGKVVFNMLKGCKNNDYTEGNAIMAWESLKNKYDPTSTPYLVKIEGFLDKALCVIMKIQMLGLQPLKNLE
jgi:hypothetical protein